MSRLDTLPAALALEVDALCDDYERHWRRADRCRQGPPEIESFVARASADAQLALRECLLGLERELRAGVALPVVPGLVLEEEIGRGGMGVVYRARRADGRPVALKLIPGAEHARWSRWLAELADLRHPHLVPLEAFGVHDGLHYVVMPLIAGGDLKERLAEFLVPAGDEEARREAARLLNKVAGAVGFLHRRGILHRDLKPSNILLASRSDREPLVCDFGLAGRLDEARAEPAGAAGTPAYMAPEQRGGGPLTPAADIWSLGAILHELLTGRPPLAPHPAADALGRICTTCLRADPAGRYATADDLADDLKRYLRSDE